MIAHVTRRIAIVAISACVFANSSTARAQATAALPPPTETGAAAPATQAPATAAPADEQGGVDFALKRYIVVFNSHEPEALAALWTPRGVYVDKATGERTEGREALAADFRALFAASPEVKLAGDVENVRVLSDTVAMVDGTTTTLTPDAEPAVTAYTAVFIKTDGKWLVDSVHETPLPTPESPRRALEPLAWMVGHWKDATEGADVDTNIRWTPSEAFLLRSFSITREGEDPFEGAQIIGWDPRSKQIRSWTFSSDGSFGEGVWTKSDREWLVRTTQTLADGRAALATQVVKQVDPNTATVQTVAKEVDGAMEPASEPVTMMRIDDSPTVAPAEPTASAAGATVPAPAATEAAP
jgi:uncharacterized protein (TIGR02246 family)